jgi:hypothetical protein
VVLVTQHTRDSCDISQLLLLAAAALWAVPSFAATEMDISMRPAHEAPVELLRPADGDVLVGGGQATVAWRAVRDMSAEGIHEWEAFLSFDGGRQWPVRITPHLDIGVSSFRFEVPPFASSNVRLMLRFGDERREVGYVLPLALSTVAPDHFWTLPPLPAFAPGEAARPGVPGVVLWAEGGRSGRRVEIRADSWTPPGVRAARAPGGELSSVLATERRGPEPASALSRRPEPATLALHLPAPERMAALVLPLLLLICRQNE